jgi:hypothetical protein
VTEPNLADRRRTLGVEAQRGDQVNGIHEVMGSIPISSTNSSNNLAGHLNRIGGVRVRF